MNSLSIRSIRTLAAALALTLAAFVPMAHAQFSSSPDIAVVNVPFAFEVGSAHFAAGRYTIAAPRTGLLQVRGNSSAFTMSRNEIDSKPSANSVAVFHRAGGQYFLAEIHTKGSDKYIECAKSRQENSARKTDLALNRTKGSDVEVATVEPLR